MSAHTIVLGVLAVTAAGYSAMALFDPSSRPFSVAIAVTAAVLFPLVRLQRFSPTAPLVRQGAGNPRYKRAGTGIAGASLALLVGVLALGPWTRGTEFDFLKMMWLAENIALVLVSLILFAGVTVGFVIRRRN